MATGRRKRLSTSDIPVKIRPHRYSLPGNIRATQLSPFVTSIEPQRKLEDHASKKPPKLRLEIPQRTPQYTPKAEATRTEKHTQQDPERCKLTGFRYLRRQILWLNEISAMIVSISCFIVIVAFLAAWDGSSLRDWTYGITFSTVISLLAAVEGLFLTIPLQSCLGQLKWMRFDRPCNLYDLHAVDEASKSTWGAVLLLLRRRGGGLAIFAAITSILGLINVPLLQQLATTENAELSAGNASVPIVRQFLTFQSQSQASQGITIDMPLRRALYQGIFTTGHEWYNNTANTTSNSTWSTPYRTLAFCSLCNDLTHNIDYTPQGAQISGLQLAPNTQINTTVPPLSPDESDGTVAYFLAIAQDISGAATGDLAAAQCKIQLCTKLFRATQTDAILTEQLQEPPDQNFPPGGQSTLQGVLTIGPQAISGLRQYFGTFFTFHMGVPPPPPPADATGPVTPQEARSPEQGAPILQALMQTNGTAAFRLGDLMDNVARSMTQALREYPNAEAAVGYTTEPATLIVVRWRWIVLPACVHFLAGMLLLVVAVRTYLRDWRPWKSSALALAFHGLDWRVRNEHPGCGVLHDMEDVAKSMTVRLTRTNDGFVLARHIELEEV